MPDVEPLEQPFPRPLSGEAVTGLPSGCIPARAPLQGRYVELVPQRASAHAADLFAAGHDSEEALKIWDYLAYGPWPSLEAYTETMRAQSATFDTIFYAIRPLDGPRFEGILEAWLDQKNFDADGRAAGSLSEMLQQRSVSTRGLEGE